MRRTLTAILGVLAVGAILTIGASRAEANHGYFGGGYGYGYRYGGGFRAGYFPGYHGYFPRPYPLYGRFYPRYPWPSPFLRPYPLPQGPYPWPGLGYGGGFVSPYWTK